jgi:hypothetical protein
MRSLVQPPPLTIRTEREQRTARHSPQPPIRPTTPTRGSSGGARGRGRGREIPHRTGGVDLARRGGTGSEGAAAQRRTRGCSATIFTLPFWRGGARPRYMGKKRRGRSGPVARALWAVGWAGGRPGWGHAGDNALVEAGRRGVMAPDSPSPHRDETREHILGFRESGPPVDVHQIHRGLWKGHEHRHGVADSKIESF